MTPVQQERERCAKIVERAIVRNRENPAKVDLLKRIHSKIKSPKLIGEGGGRLHEQLELPFTY